MATPLNQFLGSIEQVLYACQMPRNTFHGYTIPQAPGTIVFAGVP